jgi:hypothetical protein
VAAPPLPVHIRFVLQVRPVQQRWPEAPHAMQLVVAAPPSAPAVPAQAKPTAHVALGGQQACPEAPQTLQVPGLAPPRPMQLSPVVQAVAPPLQQA